jgi:hypothetical protein
MSDGIRILKTNQNHIKYVQIFGERNSGTSFLSNILQDNMKVPKNLLGLKESENTPFGSSIFGYKHWFIDKNKFKQPNQTETLFVVIYRNPYTWLNAMQQRPYALSKSISGRNIEDLPSIVLAGHINGKDTNNELHPETGDKINLFELRKLKIASFDSVRLYAGNVVYINMEALLQNHKGIIGALVDKFRSGFINELNFERVPPKIISQECKKPKIFSADEALILNTHLDWESENLIGYTQNNYFFGACEKINFVILHGSSSVGKSYSMKKIVEEMDGVVGIEMDDCRYWEEHKPDLEEQTIRQFFPNMGTTEFVELLSIVHRVGKRTLINIEFLFKKLQELSLSKIQWGINQQIVVSTCGALPFPSLKGDPSIYQWLEKQLPISFQHILIELPAETHTLRMKSRGRYHLHEKIMVNYEMRQDKREAHDIIASSYEEIKAAVKTFQNLNITVKDIPITGKKIMMRINKKDDNNLKYVQIFGERNSGTNHLRRLVEENMTEPKCFLGSYATNSNPENTAKRFGYKHYYTNQKKIIENQADTLFLVIYKNPYTWIRSTIDKPYHFKSDLENQGIEQLPGLKLDGRDVHGRPIPDVHPETGQNIDIFELRAHKIRSWENLTNLVDNVVYINYEQLLLDSTPIIQGILDNYSSLFNVNAAPKHVTEDKYLKKYVNPEPFSDLEMKIMDANINWDTEEKIGYEKNNLFI